jgi:hypothetical protein
VLEWESTFERKGEFTRWQDEKQVRRPRAPVRDLFL